MASSSSMINIAREAYLICYTNRDVVLIGKAVSKLQLVQRGVLLISTQCGGKLAHENIKSSNIFLNSQEYGCVSDFGLAGIMVEPPEADGLGFGVLLLELLAGKSPMEAQGFEDDLHLVTWVRSIKSQEWTYWEALRAILGSHFHSMTRVPADYFAAQDLLEMVEILHVAMRCLAVFPKDRPKMCDAVLMLENKASVSNGKPQQDFSKWLWAEIRKERQMQKNQN
ncbi:hypothetical protein Pfo_007098 [Paulownia fortunei]|nr:hypothetical protein Pfo_007098 [Paulownia fortunei]